MPASKTKAAGSKKREKVSESPRLWNPGEGRRLIAGWLEKRRWTALPHQNEVWQAVATGASGLLQMPTGSGKTYASFFAFLPELGSGREGLHLIYITPLRALARDLELALRQPCEDLGLQLRVESRTGDSSAALRRQQKRKLPHILITTPESLALLLSYESAPEDFAHLHGCVIDEWHELLGSKRGSLLELNLARMRRLAPRVQTWALSATLPNGEEALHAACGGPGRLIRSGEQRELDLQTILPGPEQRLPRAGHLGLGMLPHVLAQLSLSHATLIFTNTRAQAELWFEALRLSRPEWGEQIALHHGSLDLEEREQAESGVKEGRIRIVVCTSTLDLGVDFPAVDRVIQIGSPKRIARLLQRAGRSGHAPGQRSSIQLVPTYGIELLEALACRRALKEGTIEPRRPLLMPLDVLAQHMVSRALGGGFTADELFEEVRGAYAYRQLDRASFDAMLHFVALGGGTLQAYPQYCKVSLQDGVYRVPDRTIALRHRQNLGTILGDASIRVKLGRRSLGQIDESFIGRLKKGDRFLFAGRWLELIRLHELTAYTRLASGKSEGSTPTWSGQKLPWSPILSAAVRATIDRIDSGESWELEPEYAALSAIIEAQTSLSAWPAAHELLIETLVSKEGQHVYVFPFEGQAVHEGLAALWIYRLSRQFAASFATAANDFGFEILSSVPLPWSPSLLTQLLDTENLENDLRAAINHTELSRRRFRGIARIAGLVLQNVPGRRHSGHQLQTSAGLLFDVFQRFDPEHLLLRQAQTEVLEQQFESERLRSAMDRLRLSSPVWTRPSACSPLAFPLQIERIGARLSSESWGERIKKMEKKEAWKSSARSRGRPSRFSRKKPSIGPDARP